MELSSHNLIPGSSSPAEQKRACARISLRRAAVARELLLRGFCFSGFSENQGSACVSARFLQGMPHVEGTSARTAKQFPAVPSGNTTVEWVRLLGPRPAYERSRGVTAVSGKASMNASRVEVQ